MHCVRNRRLEEMGARKNGACQGDMRGERERLPERPMKIVSRPPVQLSSSRCVICQKFQQKTIQIDLAQTKRVKARCIFISSV